MVYPGNADYQAFVSWSVEEKEKEESRRLTSILLNEECRVIMMCREVDELGCYYGIYMGRRVNPIRKARSLYAALHAYEKLCLDHPDVNFYIEPLCSEEEKKQRQRT